MKLNRIHIGTTAIWKAASIAIAVGITAVATTSAQENNRASETDFSSFRVIGERNIFNQNRSGPARIRTQVRRQPVVDAFKLVGTMTYSKGSFAFFEGTSPEYQKAVEPGETIAGYKVIAVYPHGVLLESGEDRVVMRVATQMRRDDGGPWYSSASSALPSRSSERSGDSSERESSATESAPPVAGNAAMSDVLRRLMQQREKETQ
jgi:hypothetical protein